MVWKRSSLTAGLLGWALVPDLELSLCLLLRSWGGSHVGAREPSPAPTFLWNGRKKQQRNAKKISLSARSPGAFAQPHRPPMDASGVQRTQEGEAIAPPGGPGEEAGEGAEKSLRGCPQVEVYRDHFWCVGQVHGLKQRPPPIWDVCRPGGLGHVVLSETEDHCPHLPCHTERTLPAL